MNRMRMGMFPLDQLLGMAGEDNTPRLKINTLVVAEDTLNKALATGEVKAHVTITQEYVEALGINLAGKAITLGKPYPVRRMGLNSEHFLVAEIIDNAELTEKFVVQYELEDTQHTIIPSEELAEIERVLRAVSEKEDLAAKAERRGDLISMVQSYFDLPKTALPKAGDIVTWREDMQSSGLPLGSEGIVVIIHPALFRAWSHDKVVIERPDAILAYIDSDGDLSFVHGYTRRLEVVGHYEGEIDIEKMGLSYVQ